MAQIAVQTKMFTIHCALCGLEFAVPCDFVNRRQEDHANFYCPSGHSNVYGQTTKAELLAQELAAANRRIEMERNTRLAAEDAAKKATRKLSKFTARAHAGVCPHCNRTFSQLAAHMKSKHAAKA